MRICGSVQVAHSLHLLAWAVLIDVICQDLEKKMKTLKDFAESVHEVP